MALLFCPDLSWVAPLSGWQFLTPCHGCGSETAQGKGEGTTRKKTRVCSRSRSFLSSALSPFAPPFKVINKHSHVCSENLATHGIRQVLPQFRPHLSRQQQSMSKVGLNHLSGAKAAGASLHVQRSGRENQGSLEEGTG